MAQVSLQNIKKSYKNNTVIKDLSLEIKDKEFVVLVGPSGCGKSTTLRMVAGLEEITDGKMFIGDRLVNEIPPGERNVAMVFQDYALYPHMTVYENIAFSLRLKNFSNEDVDKRVLEAAEMLDLVPYLKRKPAALSGGQRQRVAMGRAIAKKAEVFLFDEPLSNLDAKLRSKMRAEIKKFHLQSKITTIYVTHDQLEAMTLADRLVVMKDGVIQQIGSPIKVFEYPRNIFVATFIGSPGMNIFDVVFEEKGGEIFVSDKEKNFSFKLPKSKKELVAGATKAVMGIRPSDIFVSTSDDNIPDDWKTRATVEMVELLGKNAYVTMSIGKSEFLSEVMGHNIPKMAEVLTLSFNLNHVHFFDPDSEMNFMVKNNKELFEYA